MRLLPLCSLLAAAALAACSSSSAPASSPGDDAGAASGAGGAGGSSRELRGERYCEVLLAKAGASAVHVAVYNTIGLNECPDAAWGALDAAKIASDEGVTKAILNGPRYWTIDRFVVGAPIDPTVKSFGGIEMRETGQIDLPLSAASALGAKAYAPNTIQRATTVEFDAGKSVRELVGPDGAIYDMQSYSVQKTPQTEADLETLGARLTLPSGWSYRTRVLTAPLTVTAVGGKATVIQDDFANSYQLSQQ